MTCNIIFSTIRLHLPVGSMCDLSLSSPSAFRRTGKQEELADDVAVDHIWTRSQVMAPVSHTSSTSQCVRAMHVNLEVY